MADESGRSVVPAEGPMPLAQPDGPSPLAVAPDEPLGRGVQRICLDRFDRAIAGLTTDEDRDAGIHAARKSMKRIRAMLRLVRDEIGYRVYRDENVVLRDTARRIAPARDAAVLGETLGTVIERYGLDDGRFDGLRSNLRERHVRIAAEITGDRQLLADVTTTLRVARARYASFPLEQSAATPLRRPVADRYGAMAGGLHRVYRRGRKAMGVAYHERSTPAFHLWRKRVKYLRYQMEALEPVWPEVVGAYAAALDTLGESLGLEHDLAVLESVVDGEPSLCPDPDARRLLGAIVLHERAVIRHDARIAGMRAFAERPDRFVRRIGSYWDATRTGR
jgi:CHAD domain-containing protein